MNYRLLLILSLFVSPTKAADFVDLCKQRVNDQRSVAGDAEHWFFPTEEIKHLSLGDFWLQPWEDVTRNKSNPVPMILGFQQALQAKGVNLLIVPIPAKATIYPEKFAGQTEVGRAQGMSPWIAELLKKGLNVIDLESHFLALRKQDLEAKYWCAQDAHFSPLGAQEVARVITTQLRDQFQITPKTLSTLNRSEVKSLSIRGDLVVRTKWEAKTPQEILRIQVVSDSAKQPLTSAIQSPILLLGDSHTLVFSDAESFHCDGAGLFDHLSYELGEAIDLEGAAGGGLVTSRLNLYQKTRANPDYWKGKKAVVWVISAREFTQSSFRKGFITVPIEKKH